MPDISMCGDDDCPSRLRCYRYMAEHTPGRQSFVVTMRLPGADRCGYFWEVSDDGVR